MFRKVLVANRGEIALRVIRACRELDVESVAVYSEADRISLHVREADEAVAIGAAPPAESYLRGETLVQAALATGCDAVHPGYGFLAERAVFAEAVEAAGLTFIGPPPAAIAAMGDKTAARRRMIEAGVPVVPGTAEPLPDADSAVRAAKEIGYPVLLKAAAGGGGKGMRVVERPADVARAFEAASHEAGAAFGDASVYLERWLDRPRHIEIQVLADSHGTVLYLGERECSIQRRHQKMIEEAPSAGVSPDLRRRMGEAAVAAAKAVGYVNAGTIEFLVQNGTFHFLEMNTRIQVEHPVTELITGLDLVKWQLRVAAGEPLPLRQEDVHLRGHAIECRITSEDPAHGFLPSTGRIRRLRIPAGPGVRWDAGVSEGDDVSLFYDPLLAKLIVHGADRGEAISRMRRALRELEVTGIETSAPFHRRVLEEPDFILGEVDIRYIERHPAVLAGGVTAERARAAAVAIALLEDERRARRSVGRLAGQAPESRWLDRGWRD